MIQLERHPTGLDGIQYRWSRGDWRHILDSIQLARQEALDTYCARALESNEFDSVECDRIVDAAGLRVADEMGGSDLARWVNWVG